MTTTMEIEGVCLEVKYAYYEAPSGEYFLEVEDILVADNSVVKVLSDLVIQEVEDQLATSIADDEWNAAEDRADARRKYDE